MQFIQLNLLKHSFNVTELDAREKRAKMEQLRKEEERKQQNEVGAVKTALHKSLFTLQ